MKTVSQLKWELSLNFNYNRMALQKNYQLNSGVVGDYFKINSIILKGGQMFIELYLYLNREARLNGREALKLFNYTIPCEINDLNEADINPFNFGYNWLKSQKPADENDTNFYLNEAADC